MRQPLFADVQLRHDLDAAGNGVFQFHRRRHHVLQNAVNAEAHAQFFFVRLHVNVAGPALHRVGENQVHQLDNRSLFGRLLKRGQIHFLLFGRELHRSIVAGEVLHHLVEFFYALDVAVKLVNRFADRRLGSHHRFHVETGHELNVVHREDVGWIRHRDRQRRPHAGKRHNLISNGGFLRNQLDYQRIHFVKLQVYRGHTVLPGKHCSDVIIADKSHLY